MTRREQYLPGHIYGGMASEGGGATLKRLHRLGLSALSPEDGVGAMGVMLRLTAAATATTVVSPIDWPRFFAAHPAAAAAATSGGILAEFVAPGAPLAAAAAAAHAATATATAAAAATGLSTMSFAAAKKAVTAAVVGILGVEVPRDEPLMAAGLDSLGVAELRGVLTALTGAIIPATAVFDYPSVAALAAFIAAPAPTPKPLQGLTTMSFDAAESAVATAVAEILGGDVPQDEPLMAAGLDSLGRAVQVDPRFTPD